MTATDGRAAASGPETFDHVVCPFCGILCDDLVVESANGKLTVVKNGCGRASAGFGRDVTGASPQIAGRNVSLEEALGAAQDLVAKSQQPMFGGLGTDVDGIRAVMALAEKCGGVVDHALSEGQYRNFRVLQTTGWFMSTLTETRNRADLIIVVATDIHKIHPRFFERIVNVQSTMLSDAPLKRTVVFLGKGLDTSGVKGHEVVTLPCPVEQASDVIAALRAILKGSPVAAEEVAGVKTADIHALADRVRKASYGVMVWAPPGLAFPNAELTVQLVSELVKEINLTSRFACLSLGGNDGAVSAGAVCSWQSGFPLRVSFETGKPNYDPYRHAINRMLAAGEGDLLVWITSFWPDLAMPAAKVPTIVFGPPEMKHATPPAVFIPIGTPGADQGGRMVRCDNVVSLPLRDLHRGRLPKLVDLLNHIELAL